LAHSFFAASHCFLVQVFTRVAAEGFDESGADAAGAGFVAGDTEVCAIAALELMSAPTTTAARQNRTQDINIFSSIIALPMSMAVKLE
jgi:hypothetical protein